MPNASLAAKGALPRVPPMPANLDSRIASALGWLECAASRPRPAFSSSFGAEDMVLLDLIVRHALPIDIFTLDTGRLPEETHALMREVEQRYGRVFTVSFPEAHEVSQLVAQQGSNGFYDSVDKRRACCAVRKVLPLERALAGRGAWVTGQRAAQSATRTELQALEPDSRPGVLKVNPLHDWSEAEVWAYLRAHEVPVNALHARRFPSIGCAPCTRAITAGEEVRAGRWWWEEPAGKECGLHARAPSEGALYGS